MRKLDEAIQVAVKLHTGQVRDGENALPYIMHPLEVLSNLRYVGGVTDEDMLTTAVLHDTVEEAGGDLDKIGKQFGKRVKSLVKELTREEPKKKKTVGKTEEEIWQLRADMLLEEIGKMSPGAQVIKLADRYSNVREALRSKTGDKLDRYLAQTVKILEIIPREVNPPLWDGISACLDRKVVSPLSKEPPKSQANGAHPKQKAKTKSPKPLTPR
jgi:(p)ppGpp synthase/HD superfamily hydrolase